MMQAAALACRFPHTEGQCEGLLMAEPAAKKAKVETKTVEDQWQAVEEKNREELLKELVDAWDYEGSDTLPLEEILPVYMKGVLEPQVRAGIEKFCGSQGINPAKGLDKEVFKKWLNKLPTEQLAALMNTNLAVVKDFRDKSTKEMLDSPASPRNKSKNLRRKVARTKKQLFGSP
ncbi:unnamed protein product [Symbiodinium natans]|uniref:Uncharacterized protein n=1 Tax=Symbiodinium natans TaxID=878477 RepID=A0A812LNU4_9DINO|nr:unnamed protein product [Symbiodinium natans]